MPLRHIQFIANTIAEIKEKPLRMYICVHFLKYLEIKDPYWVGMHAETFKERAGYYAD